LFTFVYCDCYVIRWFLHTGLRVRYIRTVRLTTHVVHTLYTVTIPLLFRPALPPSVLPLPSYGWITLYLHGYYRTTPTTAVAGLPLHTVTHAHFAVYAQLQHWFALPCIHPVNTLTRFVGSRFTHTRLLPIPAPYGYFGYWFTLHFWFATVGYCYTGRTRLLPCIHTF